MTLNFPNASRSFDARRNCVRFWGYDGALEISFFVDVDALRKLAPLSPGSGDVEALLLQVFDAARGRIYEVADKVHRHRPNGTYTYSLGAVEISENASRSCAWLSGQTGRSAEIFHHIYPRPRRRENEPS